MEGEKKVPRDIFSLSVDRIIKGNPVVEVRKKLKL